MSALRLRETIINFSEEPINQPLLDELLVGASWMSSMNNIHE